MKISTENYITLSSESHKEIIHFFSENNDSLVFDNITPEKLHSFKQLTEEIKAIKQNVNQKGFMVLKPLQELSLHENRFLSWIVISLLGEPLVQNKEGAKIIHVYDRDRTKKMEDGARYHQTRQGGSIHTDNVNVPVKWEYLVMHCVATAMVGGETILLNGNDIYNYLKESLPDVLSTLEAPFYWEYRGISDGTYQAPIVTYSEEGVAQFRYLRDYLESAHQKSGNPLTAKQLSALDALDSILEISDLQSRFFLEQGETLIINDSQVFHGRTTFSDFENAEVVDLDFTAGKRYKRTIDRAWVKEING
ncbi:TauD/TfdA family dioxygenase [Paenibacillus sp. FSL H8-0537]|uniref:TauD/TfdA family dioxygenase n=1 Tax=Paenibacillus sp. FSL H8-0537 TaxID=2921399 RepID=UPI003101954B